MKYNISFNSITECLKLNGMTEEALVAHLRSYFGNQNYRANYNKNKNENDKLVRTDPRFIQLKKQIAAEKLPKKS